MKENKEELPQQILAVLKKVDTATNNDFFTLFKSIHKKHNLVGKVAKKVGVSSQAVRDIIFRSKWENEIVVAVAKKVYKDHVIATHKKIEALT